MKQRRPYTTYTKEFKQEAVNLMETSDRPTAEIAMQLGIRTGFSPGTVFSPSKFLGAGRRFSNF